MTVCAVIVAGGRSSRMGRDKAFEVVGGHTILDRIIERIGRQVSTLAINANDGTGRFGDTGLPVILDCEPASGTPLAGLCAALVFAGEQGFDFVLTTPCDTPFLPEDLVQRLAGRGALAAIAVSDGQPHYLTGLWSRHLLPKIQTALTEYRMSRLQDWSRHSGAETVEWPVTPYDPFFNVNTPQDLAKARRIAAEFNP